MKIIPKLKGEDLVGKVLVTGSGTVMNIEEVKDDGLHGVSCFDPSCGLTRFAAWWEIFDAGAIIMTPEQAEKEFKIREILSDPQKAGAVEL